MSLLNLQKQIRTMQTNCSKKWTGDDAIQEKSVEYFKHKKGKWEKTGV